MTKIKEVIKVTDRESLETASARLEQIWSARPGDPDFEERAALVAEINAYEERQGELPPPDPVDAILFRMAQAGLQQKDLVEYIGSASKVSEVLARKRSLSKEMIRRLHSGLGIPIASLLGVGENLPAGYVRVEWLLPEELVHALSSRAAEVGLTEEELVALLLPETTSSFTEAPVMTSQQEPTAPRTASFTPERGPATPQGTPPEKRAA